jgi:ADP-L-glycero-D-manno-heptose 6-epimerase
MEKDEKIFERLNLNYSKLIWNFCSDYDIPLIYASSAATYGDGEDGFDDEDPILNLKPLNAYGWSKQYFDMYALGNSYGKYKPSFWVGFKFFNVYGNHEQHKGKMASVIWHFYNQIKETGGVKLFRSHVDFCADGEQKRDFIYVDDVVNTLIWTYNFRRDVPSDIYNLGTGFARTYNDLAKAIFNSLEKPINISYIDTPIEIRDSYQYYTCAKMDKLSNQMGGSVFLSLEEGINQYIKQLEYENR